MGIASLVLGIISLIMSFIPVAGAFFVIFAILSIIFGIISLAKGMDRGKSLAGIILSILAIIITIIYVFIIGGLLAGISESGLIDRAEEAVREIENNSYYNNSSSTDVLNKNINKKYYIGDKFENDTLAITFLSKDLNFTDYNKYATIKDGYKIIRADFEIENIGSSNKYVSSSYFSCYADGYDCDSFWSVENGSFSTTLSSGKKIKASVYFQVPVDSKSISLEYETNSYNDELAEFILE